MQRFSVSQDPSLLMLIRVTIRRKTVPTQARTQYHLRGKEKGQRDKGEEEKEALDKEGNKGEKIKQLGRREVGKEREKRVTMTDGRTIVEKHCKHVQWTWEGK